MNHEKIWNSLGRTERKRIAECAFLNLEDLLDLYEDILSEFIYALTEISPGEVTS